MLSATDEAYYGYVAAINTSTLTDGVVLDIGGGSMQLVHVADRHALELGSYPLGALRLTERFLDADPTRRRARRTSSACARTCARRCSEADWLDGRGGRLVGGRRGGAQPRRGGAARRLRR